MLCVACDALVQASTEPGRMRRLADLSSTSKTSARLVRHVGARFEPIDDTVRLIIGFAAGSLLELLGLALLDHVFFDVAKERLRREIGDAPSRRVPHSSPCTSQSILVPQVARAFVSLHDVELSCCETFSEASAVRNAVAEAFAPFLEGEALFHCQKCLMPILKAKDIISSNYRITTGPAYFSNMAYNYTISDEPQEASFTTGQYSIKNVSCTHCTTPIGVTYVRAFGPRNQHKVGKFLLGQRMFVRPNCCCFPSRHSSRLPIRLCPKCKHHASSGVLQLLDIMTEGLTLSKIRQLHGLMQKQHILEAQAQLRPGFSNRLFTASRGILTLNASLWPTGEEPLDPSTKQPDAWQTALRDQLEMLVRPALADMQESGQHFARSLTTIVRFVDAVYSRARVLVPKGFNKPDRVSMIRQLLPVILGPDGSEKFRRARMLAVAMREEWIKGYNDTDPGLLSETEVELIVAAMAGHLATTLDAAQSEEVSDSEGAGEQQCPDEPHYQCIKCEKALFKPEAILSDEYRIMTGPAYFTDSACNVTIHPETHQVVYTSGMYIVQDVSCASCSATLGTTYTKAFDAVNQHKVKKFLLGKDAVSYPQETALPASEIAVRDHLRELVGRGGMPLNGTSSVGSATTSADSMTVCTAPLRLALPEDRDNGEPAVLRPSSGRTTARRRIMSTIRRSVCCILPAVNMSSPTSTSLGVSLA